MANQLIPSVELAPPIPHDLSSEQCIALWCEAYDAGEQLLLAGLAREIGPGGDLVAAYRRWNEEYQRQHDEMIFRMLMNLQAREAGSPLARKLCTLFAHTREVENERV
jgi:hypothetical protein